MSYLPIQNTVPQYFDVNGDPHSGAVLKAYEEGTSTPISFATDKTGGTLVSSIALNASGYSEVSGAVVIPHTNQNYKLSLYPTQTAADANSSAIWTVDNISSFSNNLGGSKLSSVGNGTLKDDALTVGQAQDNQFNALGTTGGSADAYTIIASPIITVYVATMEFSVRIHATNATTTPYLQINGISNPASNAVIKKIIDGSEIAVEVGDMVANGIYKIHRNSANNAWILLNPKYGFPRLNKPITIGNNSSDSEHDIDFSAGIVNFDDGTGQAVATALTKKLDASWVAGTNQGGLDTGSIAANNWYYCFAIYNPTTSTADFLFSANYSSPTLPSGYTKKEYRGAFLTDASSNIRSGQYRFYNNYYEFIYDTPILDHSITNQGISAVLYALSVPLNKKTKAFFNVSANRGGTGTSMYFSDPNNTDLAPSVTVSPLSQLYMGSNNIDRAQPISINTNTSSQIRVRWSNSDSSTVMRIATLSWVEEL